MRAGIAARKYHYSEKKSKKCSIRITEDLSILSWDYDGLMSKSNIFSKQRCNISKIQSVLFGPYTHTFRAYRLELLFEIDRRENDPDQDESHFFGWECVSLKLKNRTIDFVIKDPKAMVCFIQAIETAINLSKLTKAMPKHSLFFSQPKRDEGGSNKKLNFKYLANYRFIKIKLKIAFEAARRHISILELFLEAIITSFKQLHTQSTKRRVLKRHEDYLSEEMRSNMKITPIALIDKFMRSKGTEHQNGKKDLFTIKAVLARV